MPIIRYYNWKWNYKLQKYEKKEDYKMCACNEFWNALRLKKARVAFNCSICDKKRGSSVRYLGDGFTKICFHCLEEGYIANSKKEFQKIISELDKVHKEITDNKENWVKEEIVNSL